MIPCMDMETYSEAGYVWDEAKQRYRGLLPNKPGIEGVGAAVYAEHPTAEVQCLAYRIFGEPKLWVLRPPSVAVVSAMLSGGHEWLLDIMDATPIPVELTDYIVAGGIIEAHNSMFEWLMWDRVCHKRWGWPPLPLSQMRCSKAAGRAWGLPGSLDAATRVAGVSELKGQGR